jgi:hypothetical protein
VKQMVLMALTVTLAMAVTLQLSASQSAYASQGTRGQEGTAVSSFPKTANPPDALLMKGPIVLQKGRELTRCWDYYPKQKGSTVWWSVCEDFFFYSPPRMYIPLPAGVMGRLHIRINNPQRLKKLTLDAYTGYKPYPSYPVAGELVGKHYRLGGTNTPKGLVKSVKRGGKRVAWNVFFRLPLPESHYYLSLYTMWKPLRAQNPRGFVFHDTWYTFHVRTF